MKRLVLAGIVLLASLGSITYAADNPNRERVLFPVWTDSIVHGANGSEWVADAFVYNAGPNYVGIYPIVSNYGRSAGSIQPRTKWGMTFVNNTYFGGGNGSGDDIAGRIAYVSSDGAEQLAYVDRLHDLTSSPALAVEIPVVRERDLKTSRISLPAVPLDSRVRLMLRVYDPFQTPDAEVVVRFWADWPLRNSGGAALTEPKQPLLLGSVNLKLHLAHIPPRGNEFDVEPAYAQLPITPEMLSNIPPWSATEFAIDVEPVTPGLRFWAFVSVTDNETQHVLTITPH